MSLPETDRYDIRLARGASGVLREFNEAGVLTAADVHVATRLGLLGDTSDDAVLLGAAFAVRAPRLGHVCVDLATIRTTATSDLEEADLRELPWPDEDDWIARVAGGPLSGLDRPLHLEGTMLYLDRYWSEEQQVARDLLTLAGRAGRWRGHRAARHGAGAAVHQRGTARPSEAGCGICRAPAVLGHRRRPGHGQDDDGGPRAGASRRTSGRSGTAAVPRRSVGADREGGGPPRRRQCTRRLPRCPSTPRNAPDCCSSEASRSTACSASIPPTARGFDTTG